MAQPNFLFVSKDLGQELQGRIAEAKQEINKLDPDVLLDASVPDLVAALVEDFSEDDIALHENQMHQLETSETQVDVSGDPMYFHPRQGGRHIVSGTRIQAALPFSGHPALFNMRPSNFFLGNGPQGVISSANELILTLDVVSPTEQQIKQYFDNQLQLLRTSVTNVNNDLNGFRPRLRSEIEQAISNRRQRLERDRGLNGVLGLPVRTRSDAPKTVPVVRKRLGLKRIEQRAWEPYLDEWAIDQAIYEEIIGIARSTGLAFERSHKVTSKFHEPELRDIILILLNGTFEGQAGGELFNGEGKTDILVKVDNRNVFIGECKFWSGEKDFNDAINQLLGYTVWRDTKASLILFINRKGVSEVIEKADATVRSHPFFKRVGAASDDQSARRNYIMHQKDDENREIQVALLPFAIRTPEASEGAEGAV